jgi:hypothetical protein
MGYADIFKGIEVEEDEKKRPEVPNMALIANTKNGGVVLHARPGCTLYYEIHEVGSRSVGDYGFDDAPEGLTVWEGTSVWQPGGYEAPQDGMNYYEGTYRRLNDEEILKVQRGEELWPPLAEYLDGDEGEDPAK